MESESPWSEVWLFSITEGVHTVSFPLSDGLGGAKGHTLRDVCDFQLLHWEELCWNDASVSNVEEVGGFSLSGTKTYNGHKLWPHLIKLKQAASFSPFNSCLPV